MAEPEPQQHSFNNASDLVALSDSLVYYLNLKMAAMDKKTNFRVPANVDKIIELARTLPLPTAEEWGSLAVGRISTKRKFKTGNQGEEARAKTRAKWSEEAKKELVELVDNEEKRKAELGDKANHAGHINWTALARRYGFAGAGPLYRQYQILTGRDPPGVKHRLDLQKRDDSPDDVGNMLIPGLQVPAEWTPEKCDELMRLVTDTDYREQVFGKAKLKFSRIADRLGVSKKQAKEKYADLTGRGIEPHD